VTGEYHSQIQKTVFQVSFRSVLLETIRLCISSGNGPEECAHAASLTLRVLLKEIERLADNGRAITASVEETEASSVKGNIHLALLCIKGDGAASFAACFVDRHYPVDMAERLPSASQTEKLVRVGKTPRGNRTGNPFFPE
jgi:protein subunit release factor B